MSNKYLDAAAFKGLTLISVSVGEQNDEILFTFEGNRTFRMYHGQECCESVTIFGIDGELRHLTGSPIIRASEESGQDAPEGISKSDFSGSCTWTTYEFETATAKVRIVWLGESNGYYSESVQIYETTFNL